MRAGVLLTTNIKDTSGCIYEPWKEMTCQQISNKYQTNDGVSWGSLPKAGQNYWIQKGCNTKPQAPVPVPAAPAPVPEKCTRNIRLLSLKPIRDTNSLVVKLKTINDH